MEVQASQIRPSARSRGWSLLLLVTLLGVPAGWAKQKKAPPGKPVQLVWPLPPEKPRIRFVTAIYGASDIEPTKKANFLDHIAGIQKKDFKPSFVKPYGIATDSHNRIFVTDSGQGLVFVLDPDNKKVTYIGVESQVSLRVPLGITVDAQDRVWVADGFGQHVYAFDAEGNVLMGLGGPNEMVNPTGVAIDGDRHRLYVVDSKQQCVLVYDSESGHFLSKFGKRGDGRGEFNFPTNLALDKQGRIYVVDTLNFRVQVFDPDYKFVDTIGQQGNRFGQFIKPKGIALDSFQNIYVVDSDFDNFQIFSRQKELLLFVGAVGQTPGKFWLPAGICIDRQNRIYVADQINRRIQIFKLLDGEPEAPPQESIAKAPAPPSTPKGGGAGVAAESKFLKSFNENQKEK